MSLSGLLSMIVGFNFTLVKWTKGQHNNTFFRDIHVLQSLRHEILLDEPEVKAYHPN